MALAIEKYKKSNFVKILIALVFVDLIYVSISKISAPPPSITKYLSQETLSSFPREDKPFRIYCTDRCISQKDAALFNLELIDGYSTLIQMNYYSEAWQLTGGYWNYYTLSIPPIGLYTYDHPQPDANALGEFNTKYILSPYELADKNFELIKNVDGHYLYQNKLFMPRADVPITYYSPNKIVLDTTKTDKNYIILRDTYSPGWISTSDNGEVFPVEETPIAQRSVNIKSDTHTVELSYKPNQYKWGLRITTGTLVISTYYFISKRKDLFV